MSEHGSQPFRVFSEEVAAIRMMIRGLAECAETVSLKVTAADFPMWCQGLGVATFYATRTRSGQSFIHTSRAVASERFGDIFFGVTSDERPAPWAAPPVSEGSRTFQFRAVEKES